MHIIFLNGASSSGKTSLARELQALLADYYLYFGIDAFIGAMPERSNCFDGSSVRDGFYWEDVVLPNNLLGKKIVSGEFGRQIEESYRVVVKALLDCGHNLIIDNVIDGDEEMRVWKRLLADYQSCYVGLHCSLDKLMERETQRNERAIGSAAEQHFRTHAGIEYDLVIDTGAHSKQVCAQLILDHIESNG